MGTPARFGSTGAAFVLAMLLLAASTVCVSGKWSEAGVQSREALPSAGFETHAFVSMIPMQFVPPVHCLLAERVTISAGSPHSWRAM